MLKKIECFLRPSKLDEIKDKLVKMGIEGMSVSEVKGFGTQRGHLAGEEINEKVQFLLKIKVEIVVDEEIVDEVIGVIRRLCVAKTIGAGKIFVIPVEDAVRIRTAEVGKSAIY